MAAIRDRTGELETEIRLFIGFLLIFSLFATWGMDNSWSRYDLTASMVEEKSFDISNYSDNTIDKLASRDIYQANLRNISENNSPYISNRSSKEGYRALSLAFSKSNSSSPVYTDKAPMSSFLGIPAYIIADKLGAQNHDSADNLSKGALTNDYIEISTETSLKQFLMVLTVSIIPSTLLIVLIYRHLRRHVSPTLSLFSTVIAGCGTLLLVYSPTLLGATTAAFFGFLSYYLKESDREGQKISLLAGISGAFAYSTEYYAAIIPISIALLLLYEKNINDLKNYTLGLIIGSLPLMFYHWSITGNPITPLIATSDYIAPGVIEVGCNYYDLCYSANPNQKIILGSVLSVERIANIAFRLLFYPARGLFFYSPVLLIALPGFYYLYNIDKEKGALFFLIFVAFLMFNASRLNWLAGISFGPRYLVVALPFLILPLALGLRKILEMNDYMKFFVLALVLISVFNGLLGFVPWEQNIDNSQYSENFKTMEVLDTNFYENSLDNLRETGPRSETLMSFTDRYKGFDITYRPPYSPENLEILKFGESSLLLSTNYIPVIILAAIITAIVRRDSENLQYLGLGIILLLALTSINLSNTFINGETYQVAKNPGAVNGTMEIISYSNGENIPYLKIKKLSSRENLNLSIAVNGQQKYSSMPGNKQEFVLPTAKEGRNRISIKSDGCTVPEVLDNNSNDTRCLSFSLEYFGHNSTEDFTKPALTGFFDKNIQNSPWMGRNGKIIFTSDSGDDIIPSVKLERMQFLNNSRPKFYLNGKYISTLAKEDSSGQKFYFQNGSAVDGINYVSIESPKCRIPAERTNSSDNRCLSYRLENMSQHSDNLENITFTEGWHGEEKNGRWMEEEAEILVRDREGKSAITMDLDPYSSIKNNTLEISINGASTRNISLNQRKEVMIPVESNHKLERLELDSSNGCIIPSKNSNTSEDRCISVYLRNISTTPINQEAMFQKGWHQREKTRSESYRWMKEKSYILYNSSGRDILSFSSNRYEGVGNSSLSIFADGRQIAEFNSSKIENGKAPVITEPGITTLRFESSKGCAVPMEIEPDSSDYRCLSFRISGLNIEKKSFDKGWYSEEGDEEFSYRWMGEESNTEFISDGKEKTLELELKPYKHLSDPALDIVVNQEVIGTLKLSGRGRVKESIKLDTERGANNLTLRSNSDCEIPSEHEQLSNDRRCLSFQVNELKIAS